MSAHIRILVDPAHELPAVSPLVLGETVTIPLTPVTPVWGRRLSDRNLPTYWMLTEASQYADGSATGRIDEIMGLRANTKDRSASLSAVEPGAPYDAFLIWLSAA